MLDTRLDHDATQRGCRGEQGETTTIPWGWIIIGLIVLGIAQFARAPDGSTSNPAPAQVRTQPSSPATAEAPTTLQAAEIRYVTATSLNVRREPSTAADVISSLSQGTGVAVIDRQSRWLLVSISTTESGWVSEQYTAANKLQPRYTPPAPISQPTQNASGLSCSPRRTCGQIGTCNAAQWYRQNCSWGGRLDRNSDGQRVRRCVSWSPALTTTDDSRQLWGPSADRQLSGRTPSQADIFRNPGPNGSRGSGSERQH